jgi:hypothetical protein
VRRCWCCIGDGGGPSVVALQGEIANHPEVRRLRAVRAERRGKSRVFERGRCDPMKANESEPLMRCRKALGDIKTEDCVWPWDESGGSLLTAQAVSGTKVARAWVRLLYRTWEPVVSRDDRSVVCNLRSVVSGKVSSGGNREGRIPGVGHRGGPSGTSEEGSVMGLERSGRAIQRRSTVNHACVGGADG